MPTKQKYKLVFCVWEDIVTSSSAWKEADEAVDWADSEPGLVHQVGFQFEKNDEHLILIDSYFPEGDDQLVGAVTRIPISVIRQLTVIPDAQLVPPL